MSGGTEGDVPSTKCNMMQQTNTLPQVMYASDSVQCSSTHEVIKHWNGNIAWGKVLHSELKSNFRDSGY